MIIMHPAILVTLLLGAAAGGAKLVRAVDSWRRQRDKATSGAS